MLTSGGHVKAQAHTPIQVNAWLSYAKQVDEGCTGG